MDKRPVMPGGLGSLEVIRDSSSRNAAGPLSDRVYVLGRRGDALLGISISGNAGNVLNALRTGKAFGLVTLGLCGGGVCKMDGICDCVIHVPETETYRVQELHLPVYHAICPRWRKNCSESGDSPG